MAAITAITLAGMMTISASWAGADTRLNARIEARTGAIYLYDVSEEGTGPWYPASTVTTRIKNCPEGTYDVDARLVQDGQSADWATGALGAGLVFCGPGLAADFDWSMGFVSPTLHKGPALASFSLRSVESGGVLLTVARTVHIPG